MGLDSVKLVYELQGLGEKYLWEKINDVYLGSKIFSSRTWLWTMLQGQILFDFLLHVFSLSNQPMKLACLCNLK